MESVIGSRANASQCSRRVLAKAGTFGPEHQCDPRRAERILEVRVGLARKPDPPEARFADLLQSAARG